MKKNLKFASIFVLLCISILSSTIAGTNAYITASNQEVWLPFSLSTNENPSMEIFRSNDTYGYELTFKVNITEITNGTLNFQYESGDTLPSRIFDSNGIHSFNVTTMSASLRVYGLNASVTGFYSLGIGNRVSLSPWTDINLLIILVLLFALLMSSLGIPPFVSFLVSIVVFIALLVGSIFVLIKGFKSWKKIQNKTRLSLFMLEIIIFISISAILLVPFRMSFF